MKTLTKLGLGTMIAVTFGFTTLLAGPGPVGPTKRTPREIPAAVVVKCDRMIVHKTPKLGGETVVKCTKAVKGTMACRLACN